MVKNDFSMIKKQKRQKKTEKKPKKPETYKKPKNENEIKNPEKSNKKLKIISKKTTVKNKGTKD